MTDGGYRQEHCGRSFSTVYKYCPFCGTQVRTDDLSTDGGRSSSGTAHVEWWEKAANNVQQWGIQEPETVLLLMQEELGELTQAHLEARAEGGDPDRVVEELSDLAALCFQLQWVLDDEDADRRGSA